jgi:hypothetical protein
MKLLTLKEAIEITGDKDTRRLYQAILRDDRIKLRWREGQRMVDEDELRVWIYVRRKAGRPKKEATK